MFFPKNVFIIKQVVMKVFTPLLSNLVVKTSLGVWEPVGAVEYSVLLGKFPS